MDFTIKPNSQGEISEVVVLDNTAIKMGSGKSPVYATPALVALMENAAILACESQLPEGYNTVGIAISVKHLAATPIGLTVTAKATLVEQDRSCPSKSKLSTTPARSAKRRTTASSSNRLPSWLKPKRKKN